MITLLVIVVVLVAGFVAWKNRVRLLSKVLGQPERRVQRHLDRRKNGGSTYR